MKKAVKELLILAYNSNDVCQDWKDKIKEVAPKLFPESKLEVGKWYIFEKELVFATKITEYSIFGYGFDSDGDWSDTGGWDVDKTPATDKEVEKALIKEAKKRGFKEGVKYNTVIRELHDGSFTQSKPTIVSRLHLVSYPNMNETSLLNNGESCVFYSGKWATIIDQPKKLTVEEVEEKLGYKVEIIS